MDGHEHTPIIKLEDIGRNGEKVISDLRSMGLFVLPDITSLNRLVAYINNAMPETDRRIRCTDKYGWHENIFVLPDRHIGNGSEEFLYQSSNTRLHAYSIKGDVEGWRDNVACLCKGNSRPVFAVSMAFAAPLLHIAEIENGGFHFYGNSSIGKSTALYVTASVMGHPDAAIQKWNATINAMEAVAKHYNDALLPLDEIGQSDPKQIGDTTYMLGNGSGKGRADSRGEARKRATFRNLFLSNGEKTLSDHMGEIGKKRESARRLGLLTFLLIQGVASVFLKPCMDSKTVRSWRINSKEMPANIMVPRSSALSMQLSDDVKTFPQKSINISVGSVKDCCHHMPAARSSVLQLALPWLPLVG